MKKTTLLFLLLLVGVGAGAQSFGDWELMCWDSAGVTTPVQVRTHTNNTTGAYIRTYYRLTPTLQKIVPTVGLITYCGKRQTDTIIVRLDSLLSNTEEPQSCNCTYTLDLDNHSYTIQNNAQHPVWNYQKFVTRNCGAGAEEIYRMPEAVQLSGVTGKAWVDYTNSIASDPMITGSSVVDSIRVFTKNPDESFWIYLSPWGVVNKYPVLWAGGTIDTAKLRFNSALPTNMDLEMEKVISYGINHWANVHVPALAAPTKDVDVQITSGGSLKIRFYIYHNPSGPYVAINSQAASRRMDWHRTAAQFIMSNGASFGNIAWVVTGSYNTPCDPILTTYSTQITEGTPSWFQVLVDTTPNPALAGSLGTATCAQPCPETIGQCVEICNTDTNPIPVTIISDASTTPCPVRNVPEHKLLAPGGSASYVTNSLNSLSFQVLSGTATVIITNPLGTAVSVSYPAGTGHRFNAPDCKLIQAAYQITTAGGQTLVLAGF